MRGSDNFFKWVSDPHHTPYGVNLILLDLHLPGSVRFWATVCKTVLPMLSDRCPVLSVLSACMSVCNVGVLWPNDWTDQDETWHAGRPRPRSHCVTWVPSSPSQRDTAPQFSPHVHCGQTAGWIKMALSMEVGLGPGYIVLDGDPAPPSKGAQQPPLFSPCLLWPRSPIPATDELLSKFEVRSFTPSEDRTEGPKIKKMSCDADHAFQGCFIICRSGLAAWTYLPYLKSLSLPVMNIRKSTSCL